MRKAERLFQLLTFLQGRRRPVTCLQISEVLEVSKRTVYRDIAVLQQSGIPIDGEAGIGYLLDHRFQMAPMMFDQAELETIRLGMSLIRASADDELKRAAQQVLHKVAAQLPNDGKKHFNDSALVVPHFELSEQEKQSLVLLRSCIREQQAVRLDYNDEAGRCTEREIEPLGIMCYLRHWTLIAYCRLRDDYRAFRIDRIRNIVALEQHFVSDDNKSLQHYLEQQQQQYQLTWFY